MLRLKGVLKKILFIPDTHVPHHDKKAWKLVLQAIRVFKPQRVAFLGDFADYDAVSSHAKDPARSRLFSHEIAAVNKCLDEYDAAAEDAGIETTHFQLGNHEDRLSRYVADKAPELHGLVDTEDLLRLKDRGYKVTQYLDSFELGHLNITHAAGSGSGATAIVRANTQWQDNIIGGHTHTLGIMYFGNAKGRVHISATLGWLGDRKKVNYLKRVQANRSWTLGFGIAYMEPNGVVHMQAVPLINYKCVVEGRLLCL